MIFVSWQRDTLQGNFQVCMVKDLKSVKIYFFFLLSRIALINEDCKTRITNNAKI